ncbi:glycoside hydrolase domain-containing protein [Granulicella sp. dw_53]|uniref:glycoside hydrolase domain-containing protein n=1 Tax=Granulicella sp. dw_53 TaxID=2719792 RepID=UPI001BD2BB56|nr:glycoside hydrolase domain-containing protein [Granulicella sp. dw_53]
MRLSTAAMALIVFGLSVSSPFARAQKSATPSLAAVQNLGFDRNDYPGDAALPALRRHFAFAGYWLTNPPGEQSNSWLGKRDVLLKQGFGFLVLANGKEDAEILKAMKAGRGSATAIGQRDAADAVSAAQREHFPAGTVLFLDQEEGGRLLPEQADYLLGWTEGVARSVYKPGAYVSGQTVSEGHGQTITTARNIQEQVASKHLHTVTLWVYDDACPPSNGCTLQPPALGASATPEAAVWQYAQSPRRKENTAACAKTYAADGNCYLPELPGMHLDLSVASSPDPSHGR